MQIPETTTSGTNFKLIFLKMTHLFFYADVMKKFRIFSNISKDNSMTSANLKLQ